MMVKMLPAQKHFLLTNLSLQITDQQRERIYKNMGDLGPELEIFRVAVPRGGHSFNFEASFYGVFQQLLRTSQRSLKTLQISGKVSDISRLLESVPLAGLINLSEFCFSCDRTDLEL